jgi:hypothetical protein
MLARRLPGILHEGRHLGREPDSLNASASQDSEGEDAGRTPLFVAAPRYMLLWDSGEWG